MAALLLLRDGVGIRYAGIARKDALGLRRLRRSLPGVPIDAVPDLTNADVRARVLAAGGDMLVSWYWVKNIPAPIREAYARGSINVHPSLLPRHRGADPFFWAIDCGDAETGVTAHRLAAEYDTGAIVAQTRLSIDPSWNAWRLAKRLDRPSLALLRDVVGRVARGETLSESPQNEAEATAAPAPNEDALEIDWTQSTAAIERRVRAAAPWPGAYMFFGDEALTLTRVRPSHEVVRALVPGEGWIGKDAQGAAVARVRTGDGALDLLEARFETGDEENDQQNQTQGDVVNQAELADAMANGQGLA